MSKRVRQSKSIPLIYGGIAGALLIVIAALALVLVPPSPPQIAEFAPQAQEQIQDAPNQQSSQFGSGGTGLCAAGQVCEGLEAQAPASTKPRFIDKARVRRCIGDPPRQIEDPQSPPCVNYFEGDNGGATWRGVTRDEIRVVAYGLFSSRVAQFAEFFNRRFEFYGRRVHVIELEEGAPQPTAESQQADAVAVAEAGAFAAVVGAAYDGGYGPFRAELARHQIMSAGVVDTVSDADFQALHPFAWNYSPSFDQLGRNLAQFSCRSLVGAQAGNAGASLATRQRSFAIVRHDDPVYGYQTGQGDVVPMADSLRRCGATVSIHGYRGSGDGGTEDKLMLADLQQQNVTTLIAEGHTAAVVELMRSASSITYQPEWLLLGGGNAYQWQEFNFQNAPPEQTQHLFGLRGMNKGLPLPDSPAMWALREVGGEEGLDQIESIGTGPAYQAMLMLASGIQAAGPRLTPENFARALQRLQFPNPGASAAPYYQATVGFAGDHSMIDDEALTWWSPTAPAYGSRAADNGGWCYISRGARWKLGQWPEGPQPFFDRDKPCR